MSKPRTRHPRELLFSIAYHCTYEMLDSGPATDWDTACFSVAATLLKSRETLPPDPPKRSYYGAKGGLRNPHH